MFHVGQMVVCVKDTFVDPVWALCPCKPAANRIYTVREIQAGPWFRNDQSMQGLRLVEIRNPEQQFSGPALIGNSEWCFSCDRFRPVREHSIEIFRDIANGVKQPEKENA